MATRSNRQRTGDLIHKRLHRTGKGAAMAVTRALSDEQLVGALIYARRHAGTRKLERSIQAWKSTIALIDTEVRERGIVTHAK
jgi:hypothetical protein